MLPVLYDRRSPFQKSSVSPSVATACVRLNATLRFVVSTVRNAPTGGPGLSATSLLGYCVPSVTETERPFRAPAIDTIVFRSSWSSCWTS